jgi:D-tagatose-1,6-bisphosphate aldolase subunit GatZ/KbaZ
METPVHPIAELLKNSGIISVCSANNYVLRAAIRHAKKSGSMALIEATCNQVNQQGGYSGMRPCDFARLVFSLAVEESLPAECIVLGGDHLGPLPWKQLPAEKAMQNACDMVREYAEAGFTKLHIDTSMYLLEDDETAPLPTVIAAKRCTKLVTAAMEAYAMRLDSVPGAQKPVFVVGSEVPVPGGQIVHEEKVHPTDAGDFINTVEIYRDEFEKQGLCWQDVIAFVVQSGVEFCDDFIVPYSSEDARELRETLKRYDGLVFEAHSTDYQTESSLKNMVGDGFKILKVGPELSFAFREALILLLKIEETVLEEHPELYHTRLLDLLMANMDKNQAFWKPYYRGSFGEIAFKKLYSFSDRCRYYLTGKDIQEAIGHLFSNLNYAGIPLSLLSLYMPKQYERVRKGMLQADTHDLVTDRICDVLERYGVAVGSTHIGAD